MSSRASIALGLLMVGFLAVSCDDSTPNPVTPTTIDLTGVWVGSVAIMGTSTRMTWTLTQTGGASVTGPVFLGLSNGTVLLNGYLTGALSGSVLTFTIAVSPGGIPTQPTCAGQIAGTVTAAFGVAATLSGTSSVTTSSCPPPFAGGDLTLTRQ